MDHRGKDSGAILEATNRLQEIFAAHNLEDTSHRWIQREIENGADPRAIEVDDEPLLINLLKDEHDTENRAPIIEMLLRAKVDPNATHSGKSALLHAAQNPANRYDILLLMLEARADATALDKYGHNVLHLATINDNSDWVYGLVGTNDVDKAMLDPNQAHRGITPLMHAINSRRAMSVDILLNCGSNLYLKTPYHLYYDGPYDYCGGLNSDNATIRRSVGKRTIGDLKPILLAVTNLPVVLIDIVLAYIVG